MYTGLFIRGPWDLEVVTNVVIYERTLSNVPHPHPVIESLRCNLANKLRSCYQELCKTREGICYFIFIFLVPILCNCIIFSFYNHNRTYE